MRPSLPLSLLALSLGLWITAGCSDKPETPADDVEETGDADDTGTTGDTDDTGGTDTLPPICEAGSRWSEGTTAFTEATTDWGLDPIAATGTRISAVDFDGDGWPDLAIRAVSSSGDDFSKGGVRSFWLLRNNGQGSFEDVTESSGVSATRYGGEMGRPGQVWAFGDVDNDGDLDIYTGFDRDDTDDAVVETSEILLNNGDGTFALGPEDSDLRMEADDAAGASFLDHDRDGDLDLWVSQFYTQSRLFEGDGSGGFEDVTEDVGLETKEWYYVSDLNMGLCHAASWSAAACDLNNDGNAEVMAASYGRAPNLLFRAEEDGSFTNVSVISGYAYDERTDWTDNESARCWCMWHREENGCEDVPDPQYIVCNSDKDAFRWDDDYDRELFRLGGNSGTTSCGDVDNDGNIDLLTSEIVHWDVGSSSDPSELLFNTGSEDVVFDRPGNDVTGLTREHDGIDWNDGDMTGALFDFDNDGWKDVYIGSSDYPGAHGLLYHQEEARLFLPVPLEDGIDHHRSHGIAVADFDRDGDLDVVVGHSSARCEDDCYDTFNVRFFENKAEDSNFLQLRLEGGDGTNRAAVGARVEVTADGVTQVLEVGGGHGHYGMQDDLTLHFGLGAACEADVRIRWPDADLSEQTFTVGGGYRYHVLQGEEPEAE